MMLVVDNNSSDSTKSVCAEFVRRLPLRYVFESEQGLSHARNRALKEAGDGFLIFTDDDVLFDPAWLREYVKAFAAWPEAAFFGGRVLPRWQRRRPRWLVDESLPLISGLLVRYDFGEANRPYAPREPTPFGASFALNLRRAARAGEFRKDLGVSGGVPGRGEETDYLERLVAAGEHGIYVGRAMAWHVQDDARFGWGYLYRYGIQKGIAARRANPGAAADSSASSFMTEVMYAARGALQLLRGRGDRCRQCVILMGIQKGLRTSDTPSPPRRSLKMPLPASWKLAIGKQWGAWRSYPETRQRLRTIASGPPILVTGAHRSGTTWFGSMLAASGIWHVHEPTAPYQALWPEWYTYAPAERSNARLNTLIAEVLVGLHRRALNMRWAQHPMMPLRWLPQPVHRVLIKDPIASLASESLARAFGMQVLVLFRHPCAFVESVTRLGWPSKNLLRQFKADAALMQDWLQPQAALLDQGLESDDAHITAAILHGCLCKVLWGYTQRNQNMRALRFEEAAESPIEFFRELFQWLGLRYDAQIEQAHRKLCAGAGAATTYHPHAVNRESQGLTAAWRGRLDPQIQQQIREIWRGFEVPLYAEDRQW